MASGITSPTGTESSPACSVMGVVASFFSWHAPNVIRHAIKQQKMPVFLLRNIVLILQNYKIKLISVLFTLNFVEGSLLYGVPFSPYGSLSLVLSVAFPLS